MKAGQRTGVQLTGETRRLELAELAPCYKRMREVHPNMPGRLVLAYLQDDYSTYERFVVMEEQS